MRYNIDHRAVEFCAYKRQSCKYAFARDESEWYGVGGGGVRIVRIRRFYVETMTFENVKHKWGIIIPYACTVSTFKGMRFGRAISFLYLSHVQPGCTLQQYWSRYVIIIQRSRCRRWRSIYM